MAACEDVEEVRRTVDVAQTMINLTVNQLDDFRTQCAVNAEVTQKQIRKLEGKLIKLYSTQLAAKAKLADSIPPDVIQYPSLEQWLRVVGLTQDSIKMVCSKVDTVEDLKKKSELELNNMLNENCKYYKEECRRLSKALDNLWRCTDILIKGGEKNDDSDLYWDSWDSYHLRKQIYSKPILSRAARCSIPSENSIPYHNNNNDVLPPASASWISSPPCIALPKQGYEVKTLATPPPCRKHLIVQNRPLQSAVLPLAKSKSHESQLASRPNKIQLDNDDLSFSFRNDSSTEKRSDSCVRRDLATEQRDCGTTDSEKEESLLSNSSPIKSPIKSPRKSSIKSPIKSPIKFHVKKSIKSPIEIPINSPVKSPIEIPIESPVKSVKSPVEVPIEIPIEIPIESPVKSPVKSSIKSPIELPIESPVKSPIKSPIKVPVKSFFKSRPPPICTTYAESDNNLEGTGTTLKVPNSPASPNTARGMSHIIFHRFSKSFNVMTVCDYCEKPMFMNILKCRECKYRCHQECQSRVPPSCGLPRQFISAFKRSIQSLHSLNASPVFKRPGMTSLSNVDLLPPLNRKDRRQSYTQSSTNVSHNVDSNINSFSCNRSTPSSPALLSTTVSQSTHSFLRQFHFPDVLSKKETFEKLIHEKRYKSESAISISKRRKSDISVKSEKHENRISSILRGNISDSEIPKRTDSQESLSSESDIAESICCRPRQNSILMREWDISYDELKIRYMIGKGRFGTIYRCSWHGDVAIKILNISYCLEDEKTLEIFRAESATLRMARHDKLILLLGVCAKPPQLGIVTTLSRGISLHTCLHIRKERYTLAQINSLAQQICQGMTYLHSREIVHKDLRSKNVFVENGKVMISDFGLFNIIKLCHGNRKGQPLSTPQGWLCYLAPEIVRRLKPLNRGQDKLPYSLESDVYAFGTIWYELLCGEWPFRGQPTEAIIWQVGKGMKQSLSNLQASRDVKDILMYCWSYHAKKRLDFTELTTLLKKLPRKKLARSSSNPTNCTRSAESMF